MESDGAAEDLVTVYTLDGRAVLVGAPAEAVEALPRGVYIINGRKVVR